MRFYQGLCDAFPRRLMLGLAAEAPRTPHRPLLDDTALPCRPAPARERELRYAGPYGTGYGGTGAERPPGPGGGTRHRQALRTSESARRMSSCRQTSTSHTQMRGPRARITGTNEPGQDCRTECACGPTIRPGHTLSPSSPVRPSWGAGSTPAVRELPAAWCCPAGRGHGPHGPRSGAALRG